MCVPGCSDTLFILHFLLGMMLRLHTCEGIWQNGVVVQAAAAGAIALGHDAWGSILFCLALNHKQMSMYHAPAFFAHLLGKCLQRPTGPQKVGWVCSIITHAGKLANEC